MNTYELSRAFFAWCYDNPEKVDTNAVALYFYIIEHSNRLGWKEKFGLPSEMAKCAIGVKNYKTYIKALELLVQNGFIKMLEKSKNQYTANIIALVNFTKASPKHVPKQVQSTSEAPTKASPKQVQSKDTIIKPNNLKPNNDDDVQKSTPPPLEVIVSNNQPPAQTYQQPATSYQSMSTAEHLLPKPIPECRRIYQTNALAVEAFKRKNGLSAGANINPVLDYFDAHVQSEGTTEKTVHDYGRHLSAWAGKRGRDAIVKIIQDHNAQKIKQESSEEFLKRYS